MIAALSGQQAALEDRLAATRLLIDLGAHAPAAESLSRMVEDPLPEPQRVLVRLQLSEALLWSGDSAAALRQALAVLQSAPAEREAASARVMVALCLVEESNLETGAVERLLDNANPPAGAWQQRARLARLIRANHDEARAAEVSAALAAPLESIPPGAFRTRQTSQLASRIVTAARHQAALGNQQAARALVWPLLSSDRFPEAKVIRQPVDLQGGWLTSDSDGQRAVDISRVLAGFVSTTDAAISDESSFLGLWLASEVQRQRAPQSAALLAELVAETGRQGERAAAARQASGVNDAKARLDDFDAIALELAGRLLALDPARQPVAKLSEDILQRYRAIGAWSAVEQGVALLKQPLGTAEVQTAVIGVQIQAANAAEDQVLAAQGKLPQELSPALAQSLASLAGLLTEHPDRPSLAASVRELATAQIDRYARLNRFDLAGAVIQSLAEAAPDWCLYRQVLLSQLQGDQQLASQNQREDRLPAELHASHRQALEQVATLIDDHPSSPWILPATSVVREIAKLYQQRRAHALADSVLAAFVKQHPQLAVSEEFALLRIRFTLENADAGGQPAAGALAPGHALALAALSKFVQDYPRTAQGGQVDQILFELAISYARQGQWNVTRDVLQQLAKIRPATLSPARGELLTGATYLGELDAAYGLDQLCRLLDRDVVKPPDTAAAATGTDAGSSSPAELKRQDQAADLALAALIRSISKADHAERELVTQARAQLVWMGEHFAVRHRSDRAAALVGAFLAQRPADAQAAELALRQIEWQLNHAARPPQQPALDRGWLAEREAQFEQARAAAQAFAAQYPNAGQLVGRAQQLAIECDRRQADVTARLDVVRAGGLLLRVADALLALDGAAATSQPRPDIAAELDSLADRLCELGQHAAAIDVLQRLARELPTSPRAQPAQLRAAQLANQSLDRPLQAVDLLLAYLANSGEAPEVQSRLFAMAQRLTDERRWLEVLRIYTVYVEQFPADPGSGRALYSIGKLREQTGDWEQAIATYQRALEEYAHTGIPTAAREGLTDCLIELGRWREARLACEQIKQADLKTPQLENLQQRIETLKQLERYVSLRAAAGGNRNQDDASLQIARLVWQQLAAPRRAVIEYRQLIQAFPESDLVDDAQLELGRVLLALGRREEARLALQEVPAAHAGSPLADDALYLIGESYESEARELAGMTSQSLLAQPHTAQQRSALARFTQTQFAADPAAAGNRQPAADPLAAQLAAACESAARQQSASEELLCQLCQAAAEAQQDHARLLASQQDRVMEAYRQAVKAYGQVAEKYPLGDTTDSALSRMASLQEGPLNDRGAAMESYAQLAKLFSGTPVAEDASWRVANFYREGRKFDQAIAALRDFIRSYPASPRVADSQFALAEVLERKGDYGDAMDAYEIFRQKFAKHSFEPVHQGPGESRCPVETASAELRGDLRG